jgi:hypothetical protein
MNDTDRTIVGLLWHENIIDLIEKKPTSVSVPLYTKILDKICFSDYIDRITFQKQIWQFNEMSSLIKTFHCNKIYHDANDAMANDNTSANMTDKEKDKDKDKDKDSEKINEVRFTKVLTKYSTEYNNSLFIQELCQKLSLDQKDMFSFFLNLRNNYTDEEMYEIYETYDISKLDINRIYRYLDKYTNKDFKLDTNDNINEDITEDMFKNEGGEDYDI